MIRAAERASNASKHRGRRVKGWEYAWDDEFYPTKHMQWGLTVYNIKTHESATWREKAHRFITTLLAEEREKAFQLGLDEKFQADREQKGYERGAKAERQRIEVAVGELRRQENNGRGLGEQMRGLADAGFNEAINAVLKVVRGE